MLIISLTTIPPRFDRIRPTLDSLLAQSLRADRIILYVPERYQRFPDYDGHLPEVPDGIEVRRADKDYGPATKLLPALKDFAGQDVEILFCDDDIRYPPSWAKRFIDIRRQRPDEALVRSGLEVSADVEATMARDHQPRAFRLWRRTDPVWQARRLRKWLVERLTGKTLPRATRRAFLRSGYVDLIGGVGGVLVRPEFFDDEVFDIPAPFLGVDDIWISGHLAKRGIPIWLDAWQERNLATDADTASPLSRSVVNGETRATGNRKCITYMRERYGVWP